MLKQLKSMKQAIKSLIQEELINFKGLDIFQVTGVNTLETEENKKSFTVNIKKLNDNLSYDHVQLMSLGLGNAKGVMQLPKVNDIVVVAFIANSENPIVLGSLFNIYMTNSDYKMDVREDEFFVNRSANGSYLFLKNDKSVRLLNDDGYGFEVDSNGNVTIRGVTINHTQTPRS